MSYIRANLPSELVLIIVRNIGNWHDRLQFARTSKHHWTCVTRSYSLREVQLNNEKNLLKIKIARSFVLSPGLQAEGVISKAVRFLPVCTRLQAMVINDSITATSQIEKILRAASQRDPVHAINIIVSAKVYGLWRQSLNKQKLRANVVHLTCEDVIDEENIAATTVVAANSSMEDYVASINYKRCAIDLDPQSIDKGNEDEIASRFGNYFVGSMICFEEVKIAITSLDVFFHLEDIDDCAYSNQWINTSAFAKLHLKAEKGNQFFELSVIVGGCVELLAVGGLVVISGGSVEPFLGSSVKPLNRAKVLDGDVVTSKIFVRENVEVARSERLLRQYYKRDSCNLWSFHLQPAYSIGFYPVNPLHVDSHPSVSSLQLTLQSSLLRMLATKQTDNNSLTSLLLLVLQSSMLRKELKVPDFAGSSFLELYNAMTTEGKWKMVVGIAKNLEVGSVDFSDDKKNITTNKKLVLQLVGSGFLQNLSRINDKNCEQFRNKIQG